MPFESASAHPGGHSPSHAAPDATASGSPIVAVALDGAGWHPAAWREPDARPHRLTSPRYWLDLVRTAERAHADFVTIEDSLGLQSTVFGAADDRTDQVRGRLDAMLIASYVAGRTSSIGLVPTVTTTHTEPFHVATGIQTLDWASRGRAGWRVQVSLSPAEARHFGRRTFEALDVDTIRERGDDVLRETFGEAREAVEIARLLWDSWEDDAIIRDVATGRFVDRTRIHEIGYRGEHLSVAGASITPRSPQGQAIVAALAHQRVPYELAATSADLVFVTPFDDPDARRVLDEVRSAERRVARARLPFVGGRPLLVLADLVVVLDERPGEAARTLERLDEAAGSPLASDARIFAGTPDELVDLVRSWRALGYAGVRLRPARLPADLGLIADRVLPALGAAVRPGDTFRERLGFTRPDSTFAPRASGTPDTHAPAETAPTYSEVSA